MLQDGQAPPGAMQTAHPAHRALDGSVPTKATLASRQGPEPNPNRLPSHRPSR
jgi:hypothetical protein